MVGVGRVRLGYLFLCPLSLSILPPLAMLCWFWVVGLHQRPNIASIRAIPYCNICGFQQQFPPLTHLGLGDTFVPNLPPLLALGFYSITPHLSETLPRVLSANYSFPQVCHLFLTGTLIDSGSNQLPAISGLFTIPVLFFFFSLSLSTSL